MPKHTPPPTYASQLHNLNTLDTHSKQTLLRDIADDITAVFIHISKHIEKGTLSAEHTAPINNILECIAATEMSQRRSLERRVRRYARLAQRLKSEREWGRRQFGALVERVQRVNGAWRERVLALREANGEMGREMGRVKEEWEMLRLGRKTGGGGESRDEAQRTVTGSGRKCMMQHQQ